MRLFDFEERETNPNPVPRYWSRVHQAASSGSVRPPLPPWNNAELVYTSSGSPAASGEGAVHLPTNGGGTRLALDPGVIPVFDDTDYSITAKVLTKGLVHSGARLSALFLDRDGRPIVNSLRATLPTISERGWTSIIVELPGSRVGAAYIQISLDLVQPESNEASARIGALPAQDYSGSAWFDDVAVMQLPRVEISTNSDSNVLIEPHRPELRATVRDLTGEKLTARIAVLDADGNEVAGTQTPAGQGHTPEPWTPELPRFGWYRAVLSIRNEAGEAVGGSVADFLWMSGVENPQERDRFGIIAGSLPPALMKVLPQLCIDSHAGAVTIPLWEPGANVPDERDIEQSLTPLTDALVRDGHQITFALPRVPFPLLADPKAAPDDPWTLLVIDKSLWLPALQPLLDKYGQRVRRWQIGLVGDDLLFWKRDVQTEVTRAMAMLSRAVAGPIVVAPTRADRAHVPIRGCELVAFAPPDISPSGMAELASHWSDADRSARSVFAFAMDDASRFGAAACARELAKRVIQAWCAPSLDRQGAEPPSLALIDPWTIVGDKRPRVSPRAELGAWRTLGTILRGNRAVVRFPAPPGVNCYLLAPQRGGERGMLVVWNESAMPEHAAFDVYLGDTPLIARDIFGNTRRLNSTPGGSLVAPLTTINAGDEPLFIEGVDLPLARFLAGIRVDPPFIESSRDSFEHAVIIHNTWPSSISGRITILDPEGGGGGQRQWRIAPRIGAFLLKAGESARVPFTVSVGASEEVGPREFVFELDIAAQGEYPRQTIRRAIELGVREFKAELSARYRDSETLLVEATITNLSASPIDLALTLFSPEMQRLTASVSALAPASPAIRRFVIPKASLLHGKRVILSVTNPDSGAKLNTSVLVK